MSVYDKPFDEVIGRALNILFHKEADIFTFAFYCDHESQAIAVCADTSENSERTKREINEFSRAQFFAAIQEKELERAALWNSNTARSFALGDFQYVNLARHRIKIPNNNAPFFQAMVQALIRNSDRISALTRAPEKLVLCCSTKDSEVGLIWYCEEGN